MRVWFAWAAILALAVSPGVAAAQDRPRPEATSETTPADALRVARAAFEYRDFERVIAVLDPWVHPPRIPDPVLMIEARKLLGVSRHVTGDEPRAREEFAQILSADPRFELDAFVIPPRVIETFEAVRKQMSPVLKPLLGEPDTRDSSTPGAVRLVVLPSRWTAFVPGGVPQFIVDQPELGIALASVQGVGLLMNVIGYFAADQQRHGIMMASAPQKSWTAVQYVGLTTLLAGYATSVILGNVALDAHRERLLDSAQVAITPIDGGATFSFGWSLGP